MVDRFTAPDFTVFYMYNLGAFKLATELWQLKTVIDYELKNLLTILMY